jgi:putative mycofactocin binding protein MftB
MGRREAEIGEPSLSSAEALGSSRTRFPVNANGAQPFDLDRPWCVDAQVSMRPEPFGALLYHFGTRRLSFLKNQMVLAVVRSLADHPSARSACAAAGIPDADLPAYVRALAALRDSRMITERTTP